MGTMTSTPAADITATKQGAAETLRRVSVLLAQQDAMQAEQHMLSHGSRLYRVPAGWQARVVADDPGVAVCQTLLQLDHAVADANKPVIFLPVGAMMTVEDIDKVCRRHGAVKTLFWEERDV